MRRAASQKLVAPKSSANGVDFSVKRRPIASRPRCLMRIKPISAATMSRQRKATVRYWARIAHNRDALLGLAAIAQQQGQDETAQHYYRKLLVLDPRDPVALSAMMTYAPDAGNSEAA